MVAKKPWQCRFCEVTCATRARHDLTRTQGRFTAAGGVYTRFQSQDQWSIDLRIARRLENMRDGLRAGSRRHGSVSLGRPWSGKARRFS